MSDADSPYEVVEDEPPTSSSPSDSPATASSSPPPSSAPASTVCSICCEVLQTSLAASQCGHIYHYECILTWITTSNTCPLCKAVAKPLVQLKYDPLQRIKQYIQTVSQHHNGNTDTSSTLPPTLLYLKRTLDSNELQAKTHDLQLQVQQQQQSNQKLESRVGNLSKQRVKLEEQLGGVQVKYVELQSINEPQVRELKSLQRDIRKMESELAGRERERCAQEALETTNKILQMQMATNSSSSPSPLQLRDQQAALSNVEHQYTGSNQHFVVNILHHYMTLQMNNLRSHSTSQQTLANKISLHERQNVGLKFDINERRKHANAVNEQVQAQMNETAKLKKANEAMLASMQRRIDRLTDAALREQLLSQLHEISVKTVPPPPTQPALRERSVQAASSSLQRVGSSGIIRTLSRTGSFTPGINASNPAVSTDSASTTTMSNPARRLSKATRSRKKREKAVDDMVDEILSSKPTLPRHNGSSVNLHKVAGHPINITSSVLQRRTPSNPFQVTSTKRANSGEMESVRQPVEGDETASFADQETEILQPSRTNSYSLLPTDSVELDYDAALAFMGVAVEPPIIDAAPTSRATTIMQPVHANKKLKRSTSTATAKQPSIARGQSSLLSFAVPSASHRSDNHDVIVIDEDEPGSATPVRQPSATNTQLSDLIRMLDGG